MGKVADDYFDASSSLPSGDAAAAPSSSCAHGNSNEKVDIQEEEEDRKILEVVAAEKEGHIDE